MSNKTLHETVEVEAQLADELAGVDGQAMIFASAPMLITPVVTRNAVTRAQL